MVPVLDKHKKPLMPCTEKRARHCVVLQRADGYAYVCKRGWCAAPGAHPIPSQA